MALEIKDIETNNTSISELCLYLESSVQNYNTGALNLIFQWIYRIHVFDEALFLFAIIVITAEKGLISVSMVNSFIKIM